MLVPAVERVLLVPVDTVQLRAQKIHHSAVLATIVIAAAVEVAAATTGLEVPATAGVAVPAAAAGVVLAMPSGLVEAATLESLVPGW